MIGYLKNKIARHLNQRIAEVEDSYEDYCGEVADMVDEIRTVVHGHSDIHREHIQQVFAVRQILYKYGFGGSGHQFKED